jgi:hypothetical protein
VRDFASETYAEIHTDSLRTRPADVVHELKGESALSIGHIALHGGWYHVRNSEHCKIAIIKSFDETYDALIAYYMNHPRWHSSGTEQHFKFTPFGMLQVRQNESGTWAATRNLDDRLLRDGERAIFLTFENSQVRGRRAPT